MTLFIYTWPNLITPGMVFIDELNRDNMITTSIGTSNISYVQLDVSWTNDRPNGTVL